MHGLLRKQGSLWTCLQKIDGCQLHKSGKCCLGHPSEEELSASFALFYVLTNKFCAEINRSRLL